MRERSTSRETAAACCCARRSSASGCPRLPSMQLPGQAGAVTPEGVRTGDPAALAALCERRGGAVLAYCREVCEPAEAALAAAEALARFRAAVWASADAADLDPERLLLSATRHAASARARRPAEVGPTRRILGRTHTD